MTIQTFQLSDKQLSALNVFLTRVQLQGGEVPVFNDLVNVFWPPETQDENKTVKEVKPE